MADAFPDDELAHVVEVLKEDSNLVLAYAFGSVAQGKATASSDLDIGVLGTEPLAGEDFRRLIACLAKSTGRPIDLIDLRVAGMPLLQIVLTRGRELFCRDRPAKASLMAKMLVEAEDFLPLRRRMLKERRDRWID